MKQKLSPGLKSHLLKAQKIATLAAIEAGEFLKKKIGKIKHLSKKQDSTLVSEADRGAEKIIVSRLKKAFPQDEIFGEESGFSKGLKLKKSATKQLGDFRWHIDPLDGTTNFVHSFPMFCVSIGLQFEGQDVILGVINHPLFNDLYSAVATLGAYKNKKRIRCSKNGSIEDAILSTGFSYRRDMYYEREIQSFAKVIHSCRALRRIGSAALDLAFVSTGQFDGFWERGLSTWDVAAGICILKEAGGAVSKLDGSAYQLGDDDILATNANLHTEFVKLMQRK